MKQNQTAKERSLHPTGVLRPQQQEVAAPLPLNEELDERLLLALQAASDKKAVNPVVLDLRAVATFTDYFLITSGTNERQVQAISDEVFERLKRSGSSAARIEGYKTAEWILLDYGDFIVHVFDQKARAFYDLERLWRESRRVELPAEFTDGGGSSLRDES